MQNIHFFVILFAFLNNLYYLCTTRHNQSRTNDQDQTGG